MKHLLLLLCLGLPVVALGQVPYWHWRAGIFAAGTLNLHQGAFDAYDGLQDCGTFTDATTLGWTIGNVIDVRFDESWGARGRVGYWQADGTFTDPTPLSPLVALPDGSLVRLVSEYELNTILDVFTLDLLATYRPASGLSLGLGPHVGFATRASFEQTESILEPSGVTFADGSTSRLILAAPFDQTDGIATTKELRLGATFELGYDIPLSDRVDLTPEIGGTFAFTNVLSSFDWSVHMVRAGLRLSYLFGAETVNAPAPPPAEPTPVVTPPALPTPPYVLLDVVGRRDDGSTESVSEVVLSEATTVDVIPLLPHVFFDSASASLPSRYRDRSTSTTGFVPNELDGNIIDVYHDILNVIGYRMQQRPSSTLSVKGHVEPASGELDPALALSRATSVRTYLVQTWKIDPARIVVTSASLPSHPSNRSITDGREENRRVELTSNDLAVLAPVRRVMSRSRIVPDPITVLPKVEPAMASTIRIASADGRTVATEAVAADASMSWRPAASDIAALLNSGQRRLVVTASSGEGDLYREARHVIGLRRSTARDGDTETDTIRERHRLVFFDFDDDRISATDAPYMEALQARLRTTSKITVTGYTDRIGDAGYNTALATRRAARVASTIKQRIVPERVVERGAGPELIHDNNLPEGRMYNRTVVIDVATPRTALRGDE